ncbi:hypothetical protein F4X33_21845 [Candidatus Poribacteria bacterium]|nr:hypothetical protein [Candidatus Poribacteria bacterium]
MNPPPHRKSHQLRKGRHAASGTYYFLTTATFKRRPILSNPQVTKIIFDSLQWLENKDRIRWICLMIIPDHIHAVIQLGCNQTIADVMHSLKSFTAKQINALRRRIAGQDAPPTGYGSVWQAEYYDRGVRGEESLNEMIRYCYENPVRKGLVKQARDYPYWWCKFKME